MSFARRNAVPFAAGVAAAAAAFAVVLLTAGGDDPEPQSSGSGSAVAARSGDGLAVFTRMGCGGCHTLGAAGSTGPIGPNLDAELLDHSRRTLRAAILTPPPDSLMPSDFGERMSGGELEALIGFLLATR